MNLPTGTGAGLSAQYFNSADLNAASAGLSRVDPILTFTGNMDRPTHRFLIPIFQHDGVGRSKPNLQNLTPSKRFQTMGSDYSLTGSR